MEFIHNESPKHSIVVLPTGCGKSWLFYTMAALMDQQAVLVVIPYRQLINAFVQEALNLGLRCQEWIDQESCKELSQLIIVSADRVGNGQFLSYISNLDKKHYLAHIFIDECHVTLTDTNYRVALRDMYKLCYEKNSPITAMTATLLVELAPIFQVGIEFHNASNFRRSTARPTICYKVYDIHSAKLIPATIAYTQEYQLSSGERGIIFVSSRTIRLELSQKLSCLLYVATIEDNSHILEQWLNSNSGGWLVATTALGFGLNLPGVRTIIHCGRPYTLSGAIQQGGRGGRSGEISSHTILENVAYTAPMKEDLITKGSPRDIEEKALTVYIQTSKECRRVILARYLDGNSGEPTDCRSLDYVLCDWCEAQAMHEIEREHSRSIKMSQRKRELQELGQQEHDFENRLKTDLAFRVENSYSEESNAPLMRASNEPFMSARNAPFMSAWNAPIMSTQNAPLMSTQNAPLMSASNIALLELLNNSSTPTNAPLAPHIRRAPSTNAPSTNAPLNETPLSRALRTESLDLSSSRVISQRLSEIEKANESLLRVMNRLVKVCPHCNAFMLVNKRQPLLIYKPHS